VTRPSPALTIWIFFLFLALAWGSSFLFIKIGLEEGLSPLTLVAYRLGIAVVVLTVVALLTGARIPTSDGRRKLLTLAVINIFVPFLLITWAELFIPSALAAILNGLVPLFTIVIASLFLKDEPITVNRLTGLVIGFAGAVLLLSRDLGEQQGITGAEALLGQLAMVLACISYAVSAVFVRRYLNKADLVVDPETGPRALLPVEAALGQTVVAAVLVGLVAALTEWLPGREAAVPPSLPAWLAVAWLGVLGSAIAYLLFFRVIRVWGATRTALVTYIMPIVGIVLGVLVLDEVIDARVIAGTVLIIGGIALVNSSIGQRRLFGRAAAPQASPD
jgi:drug/metabolite transporter (DMT)-like permease